MGANIHGALESLSPEIPSLLAEHDVPGLAIGLCDESTACSAAFGTLAAGREEPVRTSTVFSIQSASKMYTATAVMLAVEAGLVDLDEPITRYLPEFTVRSRFETHPERKITLRHLLSHTAGFTHEAPVGGNFEVGRASFEGHCRSISDTWLRFPVGHHFEYSNLGIDLAGYALQRRAGMPFHEFVRRQLLAPLGLERTTFDHRIIARETDRAVGHSARERLPVRVPMVAAGAVYTSVEEALRYLRFHLRGGEGLLQPRSLREMYSIPLPAPGQQLGFGLGIIVARWGSGTLTYGHGGGGFGFVCELNWAPDRGVGVVVLTNAVNHKLHVDLSDRLFAALCGDPADAGASPPRPVAVSSEELDLLAGEYFGGRGDVAKIIREGDGVAMVWGGQTHKAHVVGRDQIALQDGPAATGRRLFVVKPGERFRFLPGSDGRARYLQSMDDGYVRYRNEPLPGDQPIPFAEEHEGPYEIRVSGVTQSTATLRNDDGRPVLRMGDSPEGPTFPMGRHRPGIYFSPDGEALDLTRDPPTYANVKLFKIKR